MAQRVFFVRYRSTPAIAPNTIARLNWIQTGKRMMAYDARTNLSAIP